jgi:1-acyl-sn-glycerol-3-phosphate acyltransferase
LTAAYNLVWFPEGTRSPDGPLHAGRRGIGVLHARIAVTMVPVAIDKRLNRLEVGGDGGRDLQ